MQFHIERKKENSDDDRQTTNVVPTEVPTEVPTKTAKRIKVPMAPALVPIVAAKAEHRHFHLMMFINHSAQTCNLKQFSSPNEIGNKSPLTMNARNDSGHQREGERK